MPDIRARHIEHRGKRRIALSFPYQPTIQKVKDIPGAKWSPGRKYWHGPRESNLSTLSIKKEDITHSKQSDSSCISSEEDSKPATEQQECSPVFRQLDRLEKYMGVRRYAQLVLKNAAGKAGIGIKKKISMHTLRHSFATHLLESGVDLGYIQEIPGHKSPKTTMIYTRVREEHTSNIRSPIDDIRSNDNKLKRHVLRRYPAQ